VHDSRFVRHGNSSIAPRKHESWQIDGQIGDQRERKRLRFGTC
jgi:hypothetical protein